MLRAPSQTLYMYINTFHVSCMLEPLVTSDGSQEHTKYEHFHLLHHPYDMLHTAMPAGRNDCFLKLFRFQPFLVQGRKDVDMRF